MINAVTRSSIYFAAAIAAQKELPERSRALIEARDAIERTWRDAGYTMPVPDALVAASDSILADPLAAVAMELRRLGNDAFRKEQEGA